MWILKALLVVAILVVLRNVWVLMEEFRPQKKRPLD